MPSSITEAVNMTTYRAGSNAPATALYRVRGALPLPAFTAVSPASAVTWDDNGAGGSFNVSGTNNVNAVYTPANKTQVVTIDATDSGGTVSRDLTVHGTLPLHPQMAFEAELDVETKLKRARDRTRYSREEGDPEMTWLLAWDNREKTDKTELADFWLWHRKVKEFYFVDLASDLLNKTFFNSSFKAVPNNENRWAMSAAIQGVYEGIGAPAPTPTALKLNVGGFAVTPYTDDAFYVQGEAFYWGAISIDNSGVTSPAPDEVYRYARFHATKVSYLVTGLRPNWSHDIRLHFCHSGGFTRVMSPVVQGVDRPDITLATGSPGVVQIQDTNNVISDTYGRILIEINQVSGINAVLSAIQVNEDV